MTMMLNSVLSVNASVEAAEEAFCNNIDVLAGGNPILHQSKPIMKKHSSNSLDLSTIFEVANDHDDYPAQFPTCPEENGNTEEIRKYGSGESASDVITGGKNGKKETSKNQSFLAKKLKRLSQRSLSSSSFSSFLSSSSSASSCSCSPRNDMQHQQDLNTTGPDITVTNAAGRVNGAASASGSGSETSPESDQQGVVVTFRRANQGDGK